MEKIKFLNVDLIKALMIVKGMETRELAEQIKIPLATLERLLNGADQMHMRAFIVARLAVILKVPTIVLFNKEYQ